MYEYDALGVERLIRPPFSLHPRRCETPFSGWTIPKRKGLGPPPIPRPRPFDSSSIAPLFIRGRSWAQVVDVRSFPLVLHSREAKKLVTIKSLTRSHDDVHSQPGGAISTSASQTS